MVIWCHILCAKHASSSRHEHALQPSRTLHFLPYPNRILFQATSLLPIDTPIDSTVAGGSAPHATSLAGGSASRSYSPPAGRRHVRRRLPGSHVPPRRHRLRAGRAHLLAPRPRHALPPDRAPVRRRLPAAGRRGRDPARQGRRRLLPAGREPPLRLPRRARPRAPVRLLPAPGGRRRAGAPGRPREAGRRRGGRRRAAAAPGRAARGARGAPRRREPVQLHAVILRRRRRQAGGAHGYSGPVVPQVPGEGQEGSQLSQKLRLLRAKLSMSQLPCKHMLAQCVG